MERPTDFPLRTRYPEHQVQVPCHAFDPIQTSAGWTPLVLFYDALLFLRARRRTRDRSSLLFLPDVRTLRGPLCHNYSFSNPKTSFTRPKGRCTTIYDSLSPSHPRSLPRGGRAQFKNKSPA